MSNTIDLQTFSNIEPTENVIPENTYLNVDLSPYQNATVKMCQNMEAEEKRQNDKYPITGVIANPVGSGKTFIALSLAMTTEGRTLIVVPNNILRQWEQSISEKTQISYTSLRTRCSIEKDIVGNLYDNLFDIPQIQENTKIILCNASLHNNVSQMVQQGSLERIIIDEPTAIHVPNCSQIYATYVWFLSSSIKDIRYPTGYGRIEGPSPQNTKNREKITEGIHHNGWIKESLQTMQKYELQDYIIRTYPEKSSKIPAYIEHTYTLQESEMFQFVSILGDKKTLELCRADSVEDAIQRLQHISSYKDFRQMSTHNYTIISHQKPLENIVALMLNKYYRKKVQNEINRVGLFRRKINKNNNLYKIGKNIEKLEHIYKNIQKYMNLIYESETICHSCLGFINNPALQLFCICGLRDKPVYVCMECVNTYKLYSYYNDTVLNPLCNNVECQYKITHDLRSALLPSDKIVSINSNTHDKKSHRIASITKEKIDDEKRVLIVSNTETLITKTRHSLNKVSIEPIYCKGNVNQVNAILKRFKNGEHKVMLLNANYYGHGLNLEFVDDIIVGHKMSDDLMNQIIGRGQRPGRTNALTVSYVYYNNELDDSFEIHENNKEDEENEE